MERAYYKPHFGPEETVEIAKQHVNRAREIQEALRFGLAKQMDEQYLQSESSKADQMDADKMLLAQVHNKLEIENFAIAKKNEHMK